MKPFAITMGEAPQLPKLLRWIPGMRRYREAVEREIDRLNWLIPQTNPKAIEFDPERYHHKITNPLNPFVVCSLCGRVAHESQAHTTPVSTVNIDCSRIGWVCAVCHPGFEAASVCRRCGAPSILPGRLCVSCWYANGKSHECRF